MAGFGDLVGALLQNGINSSANERIGNALGQGGLGQSGGLFDQVLGGLTGGTSAAGENANSGGGLFGNLLGAAGNMLGEASRNPLQAGGLGAMAGALFGGGSDAVKGAIGGGAMAMLAGLAFQAIMKNQGGQQAAFAPEQLPLGLRAPQTSGEREALENEAELVFHAMISAAKADGEIDAQEMQKIVGKLQESGADAQLQQTVMAAMLKPMDMDDLVSRVFNPQLAAQVYAASLFAIEVDTDAERDYLQALAQRLDLNEGVVNDLHRALGVN
jgi:uncharacterized membrane protein YebE (DUF533 family)